MAFLGGIPGSRHERLAQPGQVVTPRPAASLILLRAGGKHGSEGLQVCLVQRNREARFMPGVWVFPGGAVEAAEGDDEIAHRRCAIRELAEEAGVELDGPEPLVPYSRWITPEAVSVRFDTRFYVAIAPPHVKPRPDGEETVDAGWFDPAGALERHQAGELELVFPTIKHLESLRDFGSPQEVLDAAGDRSVEPILPKLIVKEGSPRVVLPGEPGYPAG